MKKKDRSSEILQEIRIVLPGTQALLGFQFIACFNTSFKELSPELQIYHLVNLLLITFSAILLITPVAYREIRDNGYATNRWVAFTSRAITLAMICLLLGLAGDVFVAANLLQPTANIIPWLAGIATLIFGATMWFGLTILRKRGQ